MTAPFEEQGKVFRNSPENAIAKAHAASIALAIRGASDAVVSELGSIDQRLGQVLVGLDQLKRIVARLDKISERIDSIDCS